MKYQVFSLVFFLLFILNVTAARSSNYKVDITNSDPEIINTDSLLHAVLTDTTATEKVTKPLPARRSFRRKSADNRITMPALATPLAVIKSEHTDSTLHAEKKAEIEAQKVDSLVLLANPLLIDLVYKGLSYDLDLSPKTDLRAMYYGGSPKTLANGLMNHKKITSPTENVEELRRLTRDEITRTAFHLYTTRFDALPNPDGYKSHLIEDKRFAELKLVNTKNDKYRYDRQLVVKREVSGPWSHSASALAQFSESVISGNWYQGGNSNIAILGILSGQLNYDNKKNIQWENNAEWRIGFNSVAGDTLRMLSTNDDVVKINSKLGIKAGGNFFYSGSVDFSTQLFNSYNGINSTVMKTSFLTPVRLNIGVGLDYKYKKIFSLMLSPIAFKYIYMSDNANVNPNLFGIKAGEDHLSEIGSSFKSILSYPFSPEVQFDSKLSFYTNYEKVEIDWEMVCNLTINRFMSTRISFNPRYDNTVIGSNAKVQFKQLISVGFSHKFN